ncbi:hypothetical protein Poly51_07760 [Rubripirellula tenax]|uniref:PSP1 C-terminal domain-containing protein n=1 Tax=Rubripirellula tenax TaxID=2528015 RepID=A0A5C6FHZ0_9BACT|nr:hypothetical protein [Rubripirellula tenax]TWU60500.1 hypothetical protein Poly51_07760 [Rubripirellula tenax]
MHPIFLRIGSLAEIHAATATMPLERGRRVIARTGRGIELGEVIGPCRDPNASVKSQVTVVRGTTDEDELLIRRLNRHKREAIQLCRTALAEAGSKACLLDIDQIFDGGTLLMHFLGPADDIATSITQEIAKKYESIVRSRHFAKLMQDGCGPDCGTAEGGGCGTSCSGCAVAAACK